MKYKAKLTFSFANNKYHAVQQTSKGLTGRLGVVSGQSRMELIDKAPVKNAAC